MAGKLDEVWDFSRRTRRLWRRARRTIRHEDRPVDRHDYYVTLWKECAAAVGAEFVELPEGFVELRAGGRVTRMFGPLIRSTTR